ncbi:MAG TPA: twin-arginine translocase TatA/TatE family subunit [Ktedonosporobacter sp.]|nr:twin-arginine translocase TatA/TatE family subunit [Ktedonosporobacter sp.]
MGFHYMNIIIIAGIVLALFGPKALQSIARSAGKGVGQAKNVKDQVMSELPVKELANMTNLIPQVPLNSRQAVEMLLKPEDEKKKAAEPKEQKEAEAKPAEKPQEATAEG